MELCVGGSARENDAVGDRDIKADVGERSEGSRVGIGLSRGGPGRPEARCAEFKAGNEGADGSSFSRLKMGIIGVVTAAADRGVGCGDCGLGFDAVGFLVCGGGIALRSRSPFVIGMS